MPATLEPPAFMPGVIQWKGIVERPLLYLSYFFKKNRQEYFHRLTMTRNSGDYDQWIKFFLRGVIEASQSAIENTKEILALQNSHQKILFERKASATSFMLLQHTPILTVQDAQKFLGVSYPTASSIIMQFVDFGILKELGEKKKARSFVYAEYLAILSEGTGPLSF